MQQPSSALWRNDVHSRLNPTHHVRVDTPVNATAVAGILRVARREGRKVAICGAQHAMGGQQFAADQWLLDTRRIDRIESFDVDAGRITVGAGIRWPALHAYLHSARDADGQGWAIRQKQTGADDFSVGGALASNIHGRGLDLPPFVDDIESFRIVTADGRLLQVDRQVNPEWLALAVGGYGLFGVVTSITLRLARRHCVERRVRLLRRRDLGAAFAEARGSGAGFGDFQFCIDAMHADFLDLGVFACYHPLPGAALPSAPAPGLSAQQWSELLHMAHVDRTEAFRRYSDFYLSTHGQRYASDDHQFGVYVGDYHAAVDDTLGHVGSEAITELFVPIECLDAFLGVVAEDFRGHGVEVVYGTVRLIREDTQTVMAWARRDWACVVFNLHVRHDSEGLQQIQRDMRRLIDRALQFGGSFYLTYHRYARADQLRAAYPRIDGFVAAKQRLDPDCVFQNDWYVALLDTLGTQT